MTCDRPPEGLVSGHFDVYGLTIDFGRDIIEFETSKNGVGVAAMTLKKSGCGDCAVFVRFVQSDAVLGGGADDYVGGVEEGTLDLIKMDDDLLLNDSGEDFGRHDVGNDHALTGLGERDSRPFTGGHGIGGGLACLHDKMDLVIRDFQYFGRLLQNVVSANSWMRASFTKAFQ